MSITRYIIIKDIATSHWAYRGMWFTRLSSAFDLPSIIEKGNVRSEFPPGLSIEGVNPFRGETTLKLLTTLPIDEKNID